MDHLEANGIIPSSISFAVYKVNEKKDNVDCQNTVDGGRLRKDVLIVLVRPADLTSDELDSATTEAIVDLLHDGRPPGGAQ